MRSFVESQYTIHMLLAIRTVETSKTNKINKAERTGMLKWNDSLNTLQDDIM